MTRSPFVQRAAVTPGLNLFSILGFNAKKSQAGEVGIEIEVEGKRLPAVTCDPPPAPWEYKPDHSLRGDETGEYVLSRPINFDKVPAALDKLWNCFSTCKTKFNDSNRTSVHVHLNCQNWHMNRLASFSAMYFVLEEVLTDWCGEHRVGNLFCLRAKDALAIVSWMRKFIQKDGEIDLPDGLHYAGLNPQALAKFGSIEIRTLRGVSDQQTVQDWVNILGRLYSLSGEFPDPREVCYLFSQNGPTAFFNKLLGEMTNKVREGVSMTAEEIQDSMYAGIRRAQDICFCRDWDEFKAINIKDNPFGYSKKKLIDKALKAEGFPIIEAVTEPEFEPVPEYDDEYAADQQWITPDEIQF